MKFAHAIAMFSCAACGQYQPAPDDLALPPGGLYNAFRESEGPGFARALRDILTAFGKDAALTARTFEPGPLPATDLPDGSHTVDGLKGIAVAQFTYERELDDLRLSDEPAAVACPAPGVSYARTFDVGDEHWTSDQERDAASTAELVGSGVFDGSWHEDWTELVIPKEKNEDLQDAVRRVDAMRSWLVARDSSTHAYVLDVRVVDAVDIRSSWVSTLLWTDASFDSSAVASLLDRLITERAAYPKTLPCEASP